MRCQVSSRLLAIVGLAAAAMYFAAMLLEVLAVQWVTKPIPVLALALWVGTHAGSDAKWMTAGLGFSALGDLLLSLPINAFLFGLLAFLVAHLLYLYAFVRRTRTPALGWAAVVAAFGTVVFITLQPYLGELRSAVLAYVIVICSMMWRALAQLGRPEVAASVAKWSALGAVIFAISDVLVARNRFVVASMTTQVTLMVLYWSAQWMLAASVSAATRPALQPDPR